MTTIMMLALAVVLLLVAVGSLMSYIKERRGYKKLSKKILTVIHFSRSRGSDT
ncbi:small membrane protein [Klebsiella pneumoniae]